MNGTPILQGAAVSALIPQKPPMEMVDKLWSNDDTTTVSGFHIEADNVFCENGFFTEPGLTENIAQTAALRLGYMIAEMRKNGETGPPPLGYIGAVKNLLIHRLPPSGSELLTEVVVQANVFEVTLITAKSTFNGTLAAECEMKIFIKKD
ncbi:MAG: hydroxymyristoyl-ACP dehydratase [Bacteroidia bacterium]